MVDTKWADVAHYYLKSNVEVSVSYPDGKVSVVRKLGIYDVEGNGLCITPILRHLKDMTEPEAREIYTIESGNQSTEGNIYHPKMKDWFFNWKKGEVKAKTFHWLISRGFDVFGLIESGQAIRKEMGNGNS